MTGKPYKNLRVTVNGIYWIMRVRRGELCRHATWQEVCQCFSRWSKEGILGKIFSEASKSANTSEISMDSTFVKVHQLEPKQKLCVGISKGGLAIKIHITAEKNGKPIKINLSAGNINDYSLKNKFQKSILKKLQYWLIEPIYAIIEFLKLKVSAICIPPKFDIKNTWT